MQRTHGGFCQQQFREQLLHTGGLFGAHVEATTGMQPAAMPTTMEMTIWKNFITMPTTAIGIVLPQNQNGITKQREAFQKRKLPAAFYKLCAPFGYLSRSLWSAPSMVNAARGPVWVQTDGRFIGGVGFSRQQGIHRDRGGAGEQGGEHKVFTP